MTRLIKNNFILFCLLIISLLVFFYTYWTDVFRPGGITSDGWYSLWADQRRYYEQAKAISEFNLNQNNFYYPILYPLLGAFFVKFIPRDPFLFVNFFLFLTTITLTYFLIKKVFNQEKATFSVIILLSINRFVYDFVTPWTTSIITPLFLAVFYISYVQKFSLKKLALMSILTGLAVLSRFTDFIFFLPLIAGFILKDKYHSINAKTKYFISSVIILLFFLVIFITVNLITSNSIIGSYAQRISTKFVINIAPLTVFEKTFGYFFNSFTYHRQIEFFSTPVFTAFPILLIVLLFLIIIITYIYKDRNESRIIHFSVFISFILWFALYIPIGAISPFVLKHLNLHYIKPWYSISIFYQIFIINNLLSKKSINKINLRFFFIPVLILILIPVITQKFQPKLLKNNGWDIKTSKNQKTAYAILDNKPVTFWSSQKARKSGDTILIDMKNKYLINRLQLIDNPLMGAATNFDTLLSIDGKNWQKLTPNYTYNVRNEHGLDVVSYMKQARYIKLVLNETSLTDPWNIGEIYIFGY